MGSRVKGDVSPTVCSQNSLAKQILDFRRSCPTAPSDGFSRRIKTLLCIGIMGLRRCLDL